MLCLEKDTISHLKRLSCRKFSVVNEKTASNCVLREDVLLVKVLMSSA